METGRGEEILCALFSCREGCEAMREGASCNVKVFVAQRAGERLTSSLMKPLLTLLSLALVASTVSAAHAQTKPADPLAPTLGVKSAEEIDQEWQRSVAKYDGERARLLKEEDRQEHDGPYRADWATLRKYQQPQWYKDAKFGIFIHWGVYAVPATVNEWYARNMYYPKEDASKDFNSRFADKAPKDANAKGYKDLIPEFRAEKFNAAAWAKLFKASGAQYVIPVAEHHDGFSMYDSGLSDWTEVKMGPKRDTLAELKKAIQGEGLHFGLSSHRIEHNFFFDGGRAIRSDVNDPRYASLYGPAHEWIASPVNGGGDHLEKDWTYVSDAFTRDWLARGTELVEKYQPEIVYFDWWIGQPRIRGVVAQFAAFYYNYAQAHGYTGIVNIKGDDMQWDSGARDFERGQQDHILAEHWQTDTSVSNGSWGYIEHDTFKSSEQLVQELADIVSKNGNLLLNIGPRADGTIPDEVQQRLLAVGGWLKTNGEAIYGSTPWKSFGEGPTQNAAGTFQDVSNKPYTSEDYRFTAKPGAVYAIGFVTPKDGKAAIHSLGWAHEGAAAPVAKVELLGSSEKLSWEQKAGELDVTLPAGYSNALPFVLKVTVAK